MSRILMALGLAAGFAGWSGCLLAPPAASPDSSATSQPDTGMAATTRPDRPAGRLADETVGAPVAGLRAAAGHEGPPGQVIQVPADPTTQQELLVGLPGGAISPVSLPLPSELPPAAKPEFTMPGRGYSPLAGDARTRKRAAVQAALVVAIYNVTNYVNPGKPHRDEIHKGYVSSDDFAYYNGDKPGLEVKSETAIVEGKVKQFDIWLIVPAGARGGQHAFQVNVRNFRLVGDALDDEKQARLLSCSGGHLVVTQVGDPDEQGSCTVEVGLVRKPK